MGTSDIARRLVRFMGTVVVGGTFAAGVMTVGSTDVAAARAPVILAEGIGAEQKTSCVSASVSEEPVQDTQGSERAFDSSSESYRLFRLQLPDFDYGLSTTDPRCDDAPLMHRHGVGFVVE